MAVLAPNPRSLTSAGPARSLVLAAAEARPAVLGVFALRYLAAVVLALSAAGVGGGWSVAGGVAAGLFAWTCGVGFVYLLNGTTDVVEDRINGSQRPIARGELTAARARAVLAGLAGAALGVADVCGTRTVVLVATLLGLGYLYSGRPFRLKRYPAAAAAILVLAGLLTYTAGWTEVSVSPPDGALGALAIVMALWMGLVGGVAKDFADVTGDVAAGCTLRPDGVGDVSRRTRCAGAALALGGLALLGGLDYFPVLRWAGIALALGALAVVHQCVTTVDAGSRPALRGPYRAFMRTQYGVHLVLIGGVVVGLLVH